jgi:neutral ceramidase
MGQREVWGRTRNRSLDPYVHNDEVDDRRTDPQRKYVSINPWLHLLRVDAETDGGLDPLAALVVFSVHGTGISMGAPEYNADLWAYLVGELGHRIRRRRGAPAVVGAIEGTHADVAPALRPTMAGHVEARRLGRSIGAEAAVLYDELDGELRADVTLAAGLREIDLESSRSIDGIELARRPAVGAALVAGAHENVTPIVHRIPPFRAGTPKPWRTRHPQGEKWVIGTRWLQPLVVPTRSFPRVLPLQVVRIGDRALVGRPFEVTVASGRRIASAVASEVAEEGVAEVVVSSVANEYVGYVATPEEYARQHYEGGHTLYGPATQPFLAAHAARWASEVIVAGGLRADVADERRFDLRCHRYLPEAPDGASPGRRFAGAARYVDPTRRDDGYWELEWIDAAPGGLDWHEPLVVVEASDDGETWEVARSVDGRPVDDQGWDLEVEHRGPEDDTDGRAHRYRVRWHDPSFRAGRRHRVALLANAGRPAIMSEPFD